VDHKELPHKELQKGDQVAEITKDAIDEFVTDPCWREIKERLKLTQERLFNEILNVPIEEIEPLRIEYKKIAILLGFPKTFRDELEEENG